MSKLKNILFMGGQQAGNLALATLRAIGHRPDVIAYSQLDNATMLNVYDSIKGLSSYNYDLLVCVHGREIVPESILKKLKFGGINLHPCLSKYPGADPIGRYLADGGHTATVGAHYMTGEVDKGPVICEFNVETNGCKTREEVYEKLYPYSEICIKKGQSYMKKALEDILDIIYLDWTTGSPPNAGTIKAIECIVREQLREEVK